MASSSRTGKAAVFADLLLLAGRGSGEGNTRTGKRRRCRVDDGDVDEEVITTKRKLTRPQTTSTNYVYTVAVWHLEVGFELTFGDKPTA